MGSYIYTTLCHKISFDKQDMRELKLSEEEIHDIFKTELNIDLALFKKQDTEDIISYTVNEDLFNKYNLITFLIHQYKLMELEKKEVDSIIGFLEKHNTYQSLVEAASDKPFENFQALNGSHNMRCTPWDRLRIQIETIVFMVDGKAYIECYENLFRYLENSIRDNSPYEISKILKIVLV